MKKVISFSLWGDNPIYTIGAIRNAELAKTIYPDWSCRYYIGKSTPIDIVEKLQSLDNTEVIIMNSDGDWTGMFWRFYPASEDDVDIMISRDCDSRLNLREKAAVDEWLNSDKGFHIMRDHPYHGTEILGGMWGSKKGVISEIKSLIDEYIKGNFWQVDQNFLREKIYPLINENVLVHDEFFGGNPFPIKREKNRFIGEKININENPLTDDYKLLL